MPTRVRCLQFYSIYGAAKMITLAVVIMIVAHARKTEIDEYYNSAEVCQKCFDEASNTPRLVEFGVCSKEYGSLFDLNQHGNLINSYAWLRGPAGRSSGVFLYIVHAALALIVLTGCAVVLVLFGWVFDNWKYSDHQIMFEVGLWASFVTLIEGVTLSRLYSDPKYHDCYLGSYSESVFVANWALVIIVVAVFIMFELVNWCCAQSSARFVQEKSCRIATGVIMGGLACVYALFGLIVVGSNVAGPGQDWACMIFTLMGAIGAAEAIFIYAYYPPSHGHLYEPA